MTRVDFLRWPLIFAGVLLAQTVFATDRDDALAALRSTDVATRAAAIAWIADNGREADAELLRRQLGDDDPRIRGLAEQGVWMLWSRSGDEAIDALMAKGMEQMHARQLKGSIATFSEVIRRKPAFAEGWNKRATALFLAGELKKSLADCDEVIKRNPNHFGALAGYGQIYFQLEQYEKAIAYWKRALAANPNMASLELSIGIAEKRVAQRRSRSA